MPNNYPSLAFQFENPPFDSMYPAYMPGTLLYIRGGYVGRRHAADRAPHPVAGARGIKSSAAASTHREARFSKSPLRLARGRRRGGHGHGQGGAPPDYRRWRRREEDGAARGARAGAAEAELVVARHRARRGVGAAPPRDAPRGAGAAARAQRHGRRPRRAPRLHRSGVRVRAARRQVRVRRVRRRRREEPPPRDAPGPRPLLRRPRRWRRRRRGGGGVRVHVRRRIGGFLRGVAARQPHVHTLSRRHAGDGEDASEAVGTGGGSIHADPPLNSRTVMSSPPIACIERREKNHSRCRRKESPPASIRKKGEKEEKKFCY